MQHLEKYVSMWVEENTNFFDLESSLLNYGARAKKQFGIGMNEALIVGHDFSAELFYPQKELSRIGKAGYRFFMDDGKFKNFLNKVAETEKDFSFLVENIQQVDIKKASNDKLDDLMLELGLWQRRIFSAYSLTQPEKISLLESELIKFLKKKKVNDIVGSMSILTTGERRIVLHEDEKILSNSFGDTVKKESYETDISLVKNEVFHLEKSDLSSKKRLIKKLGLSEKYRKISDILSTISEDRMIMRLYWMRAAYVESYLHEEICRRFKLSKKTIRMYSSQDIVDLLTKGKKVAKEIISERIEGSVILMKKDRMKRYVGKTARDIIAELSLNKNSEEIKGVPAFKGKFVGKVIILSFAESEKIAKKMEKVNKKSVIVSEMTRPSIMMACKKAAAIVTNEGGITCHAAIVARELKKPCIIGTKIATQVLKDGDLVEVDAEKGVVRILKRAKK